ncbi:MAG TPA: M23 family metallopeptidase [Candidatus Paceibacterota bacterium]|nr:M23 family metallopeptidase [Candidatus Paceibacterota bacterium]
MEEVVDTYGEPRGADRRHEGIDIFAPRGTYIVSATEGIVARIGENRLGGTIVFILGPGGERYYYAHLDSVDPMLTVGQRVGTSTILGRVGTTGNAAGTPPHLHFGIYGNGGARNPYERLR